MRAAMLAFATVCVFAASPSALQAALYEVRVVDAPTTGRVYLPRDINIAVGDTVRWVNDAGGNPHDVTADDRSWASPQGNEFTYERTFNTVGNFGYFCDYHDPNDADGTHHGIVRVTVEGVHTDDLSLQVIGVNNNIVYAAGDPIIINTEITNVGSVASPAYAVNYYISTDSQVTAADTLLGSSNRPSLGPVLAGNFPAIVNLPGSLAGGNYYIGGIIDIDDANNANNSNLDNEPISVEGGGGGGFALNPGHNGNWWAGISRNGEGVQLEVSNSGTGGLVLVATMYSYNALGEPIFLLAVGPVVNGEAAVDVYVYEGPSWGAAFDPTELVESDWGTGLFTASSCDSISMTLTPNAAQVTQGYTPLSYELVRLTTSAIPCPL